MIYINFIGNFFTNRKTTIREMAKKVGDFHERFANNEVVGDSKDKLVITQIFDEEKIQSPKLRFDLLLFFFYFENVNHFF